MEIFTFTQETVLVYVHVSEQDKLIASMVSLSRVSFICCFIFLFTLTIQEQTLIFAKFYEIKFL